MVIELGARTSAAPAIVRMDDTTHVVYCDGKLAGFVSQEGNVFVALEGRDLATACEVGQSLIREVAVHMVERAG